MSGALFRVPLINIVKTRKLILPLIAISALPACFNGGSSSTSAGEIAGLSLPDQLEVVSVEESQLANTPMPGSGDNPVDDFSLSSEYFSDQANAYVWNEALEPLNTIGEILGMIGQTRADQFVNQGAYIALVDEDEESVGEGSETSGSQGQSSSGNATELNTWVVKSTRDNNNSDQITRVWVPMLSDDTVSGGGIGGGLGQQTNPHIFGKATVAEGVSDTNPYGSFELHFAMKEDVALASTVMEKGILRSVDSVAGYMGFGFVTESDLWQGSSRVEVRVADDESSGLGRVIVTEPDWENGGTTPVTTEFNIAFDTNNFVRRLDGGTVEIFERDLFDRNTWAYNLYYATGTKAGERVDLVGGFPIQKNSKNGWADYWGIWTEPGMDLVSGDTVTAFLPSGTEQDYTVVIAPGRLMRVSAEALPLADLDLATFQYWTWNNQTYESVMYLTEYRHDTNTGVGEFWAVATWNEENMAWDGLGSTTDDIDVTPQTGEWMNFWSESLGGNVEYIGGETTMGVHKQEYVSGDDTIFNGDTSLNLYGVVDCLDAQITEVEGNLGDIYVNGGQVGDLQSPYAYVFQKSDRTLYLNNGGLSQVGLVAGAEPNDGPNSWGMISGPMVSNAATLAAMSDPWQVWSLDEYYQYETGHNEWNQFRALMDGSEPVTFDSPISFMYTHAQHHDANNDASHDGETVFLQYGGNGSLWGIPYTEDTETGRWYPAFSIADGTVMGPNGDEYVIKSIETELFMRTSTDTPSSALLNALDLAASLVPPAISEWVNPADQSKPIVLDAPKVVAGVIQ
jgi:hypothetical protein